MRIGAIEDAQVINYLKVTKYEIALLLNFDSRSLEYRRFILSKT
jgi:GxxExxY protein